jgi:hypothetical protein
MRPAQLERFHGWVCPFWSDNWMARTNNTGENRGVFSDLIQKSSNSAKNLQIRILPGGRTGNSVKSLEAQSKMRIHPIGELLWSSSQTGSWPQDPQKLRLRIAHLAFFRCLDCDPLSSVQPEKQPFFKGHISPHRLAEGVFKTGC